MTSSNLPPLRMGATEWLLLVLLSGLWGGSFFFNAIAVAEWPPFVVVLARVGVAAAILLAIMRFSGHSLAPGLPLWRSFVAMGLLNNLIPFTLILWGQTQVASGLASILNATTPIFTVMVMGLFAGERITGQKIGGVAAGLAGVGILMGTEALSGLGGNLVAQFACLGAAFSYAVSALVARRFRRLSPLTTAAGQLSATTVMTLPIVLVLHPPWTLPVPSGAALLAILGLAVVSTALAYAIFFRIMRVAGPTNVALVTFLVPVSAILLGTGLLGETLLPRHLAGMAAIFLGLALIDGRLGAWLAARRRRSRPGAP